VVDIFDEVEEELRAERAQKLLRRYAGLIVGVALLIVGLAAAWQAWQWWQAKQDMAAATQFVSAMLQADSAGADKAQRQTVLSEFESLAARAPEGYRTLARLRAAALKADAGDIQSAAALWDQVASDSSADPLLRDLASLLWASHLVDNGDPARVEARLKALATPGNAWRAMAEEQLAVLDMRRGRPEQAKAELQKLAQDITAPNGVRVRASALLTRLGG